MPSLLKLRLSILFFSVSVEAERDRLNFLLKYHSIFAGNSVSEDLITVLNIARTSLFIEKPSLLSLCAFCPFVEKG